MYTGRGLREAILHLSAAQEARYSLKDTRDEVCGFWLWSEVSYNTELSTSYSSCHRSMLQYMIRNRPSSRKDTRSDKSTSRDELS